MSRRTVLEPLALPIEQLVERIRAERPVVAGCGLCHYGLLAWPDPAQLSIPLYLQRALALRMGRLVLCDCPAGMAQRNHAQTALDKMRGGATRMADGKLSWDGAQGAPLPDEYVAGGWWAAVRAAELVEFVTAMPTVHGVFAAT
jgi:hypothetical protein